MSVGDFVVPGLPATEPLDGVHFCLDAEEYKSEKSVELKRFLFPKIRPTCGGLLNEALKWSSCLM